MRQEPLFAVQPTAVSDELAARSDDAVTGNDETDGVRPVGGTDGANGARIACGAGELAVGNGRARRHLAELRPDGPLKRRAAGIDGDGAESVEIAVEVAPERADDASRILRAAPLDVAEAPLQGRAFARPRFFERESTEAAALNGHDDSSDWRRDFTDFDQHDALVAPGSTTGKAPPTTMSEDCQSAKTTDAI